MEMVTSVLEPVMNIPPPCQTRNGLTFGQFREVSSAGGVGRKFQERATYIFSFIVVDVGVCYCHCATNDVHPATLPNKEGAHIRSVRGSFFRRGRRKKVPGRFQRQARTEPVSLLE